MHGYAKSEKTTYRKKQNHLTLFLTTLAYLRDARRAVMPDYAKSLSGQHGQVNMDSLVNKRSE